MRTTITKKLGLFLVAVVFVSCSKGNGNQPNGPEKGYATGKVVDLRGNPIAGAKIYLDNAAFHDSYTEGTTSEDGTYKIKVYEGAWKAYASFKKEYNGKSYSLQLFPDNTSPFSEEGGVRNFTWKLEGIDPDNDLYFYGGQITVHTSNDFQENYEDIELTFTPNGPLIDGSQSKTIKLKYGDPYWKEYGYIKDIPIGRYNVTAVVKNGSSDMPLKIQNWHTKGNFDSKLQLDFIPDNETFRPRTEASIVIGY